MLFKQTIALCVCASLVGASSFGTAQAAMIGTDRAVHAQQHEQRVTRVQRLLSDESVEQRLVALGVDPSAARERVASLSDTELSRIEQELDTLPAGGDSVLAVAGTVFIVLLILELVGVIDIFKKT